MIKEANKIAIIGGPGTGKTTLADNLGRILKLPIYHIDGIHHLKNWEVREKEERDKLILEKVNKPKWVIDGTYRSTIKNRIDACDIAIFLDYPSIAKLKGILSRYFKLKGKERSDMPGCKERMSMTFIKFTLDWNKNKRKEVLSILEKSNKALIFRNRRSLNKWYKENFGEKIKLD